MTESDPHLSELISSLGSSPFVSIEFFPPKTSAGVEALYKVLNDLKAIGPLFADVTWGAGGSTSDLTFDICKAIKETHGMVTNMHLTCTNMALSTIEEALAKCKAAGITNILALRGDPPVGQEWQQKEGGFSCALSLIEHIKKSYGDFFGIACTGYPEGHPSAMTEMLSCDGMTQSELERCSCDVDETTGAKKYIVCLDSAYRLEMEYLKKKVDAGASIIITQMFFDYKVFASFVSDCRSYGITVPILPGLMLISSYAGFNRMIKFCKTRVPEEVSLALESVKDDEGALKAYGVNFGVEMCKKLIDLGVRGLHFYTLNQSTTTMDIVAGLVDVLPQAESRQGGVVLQ